MEGSKLFEVQINMADDMHPRLSPQRNGVMLQHIVRFSKNARDGDLQREISCCEGLELQCRRPLEVLQRNCTDIFCSSSVAWGDAKRARKGPHCSGS